jgi:uncharacterized membrane protein
MEGLLFGLPLILVILLALCAIPLGLLSLVGLVFLALKIVAIVQKAGEPPTVDAGRYDLDQGKEVGKE